MHQGQSDHQSKLTQKQRQQGLQNKLKQSIDINNPIPALKDFLKIRPVGCKIKDIVNQDLDNFQLIISKIPQKQYPQLIKKLSQQQCQYIIDYIHRFMQCIREGQKSVMVNGFSLYNKIVQDYGPTIIINAISRNDTITNRIPNDF